MAAYAPITYQKSEAATLFDIPFDYLTKRFIRVYVENSLKVYGIDYDFLDKTRIRFLADAIPAKTRVKLSRETDASALLVSWKDASVLRATDLALSQLQLLHIAEEARVTAQSAMGTDYLFNWDALGRRLKNLGNPLDDLDAVNRISMRDYVDQSIAGVEGGYGHYQQNGIGAAVRNYNAKLREVVSSTDFGAIADGTYHPLSERFDSLWVAQLVYPFVTSLSQSLDWAGLQAAVNYGNVMDPEGRWWLNDTVKIPKFRQVVGSGRGSWNPAGRERNNPIGEVLDKAHGTVYEFFGSPSTTASANRKETYFNNIGAAFLCDRDSDGVRFASIKVLAAFNVRDSQGNITTQLTDNHAMFGVGIWARDGDDFALDNVSVVGYWQVAGVLLDGTGRTSDSQSEVGGMEGVSISNCVIQGWLGLCIIGGDEGVMPSADAASGVPATGDAMTEGSFGMSHIYVANTRLYGENHHSQGFVGTTDEQRSRKKFGGAALYIDGRVNSSGAVGRINNPRFVNCSIHTNESYSMILDHVSRPSFVNFRIESSPVLATKNCLQIQATHCEWPYSRGTAIRETYMITRGSGYTVATVTVTGGGGSGAAYTAHINSLGQVDYLVQVSGGSGYITEPTITISGDGSGATVRCIIQRSFQSPEMVPNSTFSPSIRRMGGIHLARREFVIEFRNNSGVVEHRFGTTLGGQHSNDVEKVMNYAISYFPAWDYTAWTPTPQPGASDADDFTSGIFLGPKNTGTKSVILTPITIEGVALTTQEARWAHLYAEVLYEAFTATDVVAECEFEARQAVAGRAPSYSGCLRILLKSDGGTTALGINTLPSVANGPASLRVKVSGDMYDQVWGQF